MRFTLQYGGFGTFGDKVLRLRYPPMGDVLSVVLCSVVAAFYELQVDERTQEAVDEKIFPAGGKTIPSFLVAWGMWMTKS